MLKLFCNRTEICVTNGHGLIILGFALFNLLFSLVLDLKEHVKQEIPAEHEAIMEELFYSSILPKNQSIIAIVTNNIPFETKFHIDFDNHYNQP